jgi:23S rRNA pseudouridine2605 synthase
MPAEKKTAAKKTSAKKTVTKKTVAKKTAKKKQPEVLKPELSQSEEMGAPDLAALQALADPIGDETDGEAATSTTETEVEAPQAQETEPESEAVADADADAETDSEADEEAEVRPAAKLERLQKILARAGVASRRAAEKLIEEGRVQVNGKVVTELGTKADAGRDHIRVDGKLLQGAERLRYFVLNKPRGFVTTVKDPEGRPTVMQFFEKMRERLYPVGRLDYLSEGLLLVTNDGELANRLTRAALGVEKTYLVKVAGVPTEEELDRLRAGVAIDKGAPGEGRVRTSPARIRQVRHGDNPWYEVVLVEGRNRELRKMFEEIGHFVEKIRRVGYGPLVLDQEPGNFRELDEHELTLLRKAADGTLRAGKNKSAVKLKFADSLPPEKPAFRARAGKLGGWKKDGGGKPFGGKPFGGAAPARRPAAFNAGTGDGRTFEAKPFDRAGEEKPFAAKTFEKRRPFGGAAPQRKTFGASKPAFGRGAERTGQSPEPRPAWKRDERAGRGSGARPAQRFGGGATDRGADRPAFGAKPAFRKPFAGKPAAGRSFGDKPRGGAFGGKPEGAGFGDRAQGRSFDRPAGATDSGSKPAWKKPGDRPSGNFGRKPGGSDRPPFKREFKPRPPAAREVDEPMNFEPRKPSRLRIEPIEHTDGHEGARPQGFRPERSGSERSRSASPRPEGFRPQGAGSRGSRPEHAGGSGEFKRRPFTPRPDGGRGGGGRASGGGATGFGRASFGRSTSGPEGGGRGESPRPFQTESGLPRPFTTSSGKPRAGGPRPSSRPGKPSGEGWKPKPGGRPDGKTGFKPGFKSGPRAGGSGRRSEGRFKGKPGGKRRG